MFRIGALLALVTLGWGLAGCSPDMFTGDDRDSDVTDSPTYRKVGEGCNDLNVASSNLTVPDFLKMVDCLNSTGTIDPIARLVGKLSVDELYPIVDTSNRLILNNRPLMYQLESTFYTLQSRKLLTASTQALGRILENEDLVTSAIGLLRETGYVLQGPLGTKVLDPEILKTLEIMSRELRPERMALLMDYALSFGGARAFQELEKGMRGESPKGRTLATLVHQILEYWRGNGDPKRVELGEEVVRLFLDEKGTGFQIVDETMGYSVDSIKTQLPRFSSVLKVNFALDGSVFDGLTTLFHYGHQPISCMMGTKSVPDATEFVTQELLKRDPKNVADFIHRDNLLTMVAVNPFCTYPEQLGKHYGALVSLADTEAVVPCMEMMQTLNRHGLTPLMINVLADTGSAYAGGPAENTAGLKLLLPVGAEISDRGLWDQLLLVATLLRKEDRQDVLDVVRFLAKSREELGGRRVLDVVDSIMQRVPEAALIQLVEAAKKIMDQPDPLLVPVLTELREALHANDVHPLITLGQEILKTMGQNTAFCDTFFKISEMDEFKESVRLVAAMSKDGTLENLMASVLTLFHNASIQGKSEIHETQAPAFVPRRSHDWIAADLGIKDPALYLWDTAEPCRNLDLNLRMDDYNNPGFETQLTRYLGCLNNNGQYADAVSAIDYLRTQKTEDGRTFFNFNIDLIRNLGFTQDEMAWVGDQWIASYDDGRFGKLLDALPYWIPAGTGAVRDASPLYHFAKLAGPLLSAREALDRLAGFGAQVLRWSRFPTLLSYAEEILDRDSADAPYPAPPAPSWEKYNTARINRWIRNKECNYSEQGRRDRVIEVVSDYENAITNWDLVDGKTRKSWSKYEFWSGIQPILSKAYDPKQSDESRWVVDAMVNVLKYFTHEKKASPNGGLPKPKLGKHYPPEFLGQWLHDLSEHTELITYFYPDEKLPRVRIINGLDFLELILINADFSYILPTNFGLKFLAEVGEAWGDEPREAWPKEIQEKYPRDQPKKRPKTLLEAVKDIDKTLRLFETAIGYPDLQGCPQVGPPEDTTDPNPPGGGAPDATIPHFVKAGIWNNRQVVPFLYQMLPGSKTSFDGYIRVLRDLFWEMYMSTPEKDRSPTKDWKNNLKVVIKMVRLGMTRQISRMMMDVPERTEEFNDFFRSFIALGTSDEAKPLLRNLFQSDPNDKMIWDVLFQVFDILGRKKERDIARMKQLGFYAFAAMRPLSAKVTGGDGPLGTPAGSGEGAKGPAVLGDPTIRVVTKVLDVYEDYLLKHSDKIRDLLTDKEVSALARDLYRDTVAADGDPDLDAKVRAMADVAYDFLMEPTTAVVPHPALDAFAVFKAIEESPGASEEFDAVIDRFNKIQDDPSYQSTGVGAVVSQIVDFFEEPDPHPVAWRLRSYTADRIEARDLDQLLVLMSRDPEKFYDFLETFTRYTETQSDGGTGLRQFFDLVRHTISSSPDYRK